MPLTIEDILAQLGVTPAQELFPTAQPQDSVQPSDPGLLQDILSGTQPVSADILREREGVETEKLSTRNKVFGGLSDALRAYASINTGRGFPRGPGAIDQLRSARQGDADRKRQDLLLRAGQAEKGEARDLRTTERKIDRQNRLDEKDEDRDFLLQQQADERARGIAAGEAATNEDIMTGLETFGIDATPFGDLSTSSQRAAAKGAIARKSFEQQMKLANRKIGADDRRQSRGVEQEMYARIGEMEDALVDPAFLGDDPAGKRKSFMALVRRTLGKTDPEAAGRVIEEFELNVGTAIDEAIAASNAPRPVSTSPAANALSMLGGIADTAGSGGGSPIQQQVVAGGTAGGLLMDLIRGIDAKGPPPLTRNTVP